MKVVNYICAVHDKLGHLGTLHEWAMGAPGQGTIVLCDIHLEVYKRWKMTPQKDPCECGVCKQKRVLAAK